jgi:colanic acid biosynthesis glycosyl transferase WcaI
MDIQASRSPSMIILTQYYPPEPGAASLRLQAMAQELARAGWTVKVVTAFPHHLGYRDDRYRRRLTRREQDGPVSVVRTWIWVVPTGSFWRRLLNYFSFVATSLWGLRQQGRADYLLVESPPLFLGISAYLYARWRRMPYILSVSDLWPESAVALGLVQNPWLIRWAKRLEYFLYRHAYRISAVTEGIRDAIAATGVVRPHHILFAPNGVYPDRYAPRAPDPKIQERLGLGTRHVFLYPGTLGYAQGLEVILDAAEVLKAEGLAQEVAFLMVGDGPVKADLQRETDRRRLHDLVIFEELQPAERMPLYFALARAVVVPLRKHRLFQGARPSKAFPAWAAGVPVIFSGEGEMARVVEQSGAGITVPPGDGPALAMAVKRLHRLSDEETARLGELGRQFVEREYAWPRIMERWMRGLEPI